jgi:hypothetical protein
MARQDASDLAHRLGRQADAVCRYYLSCGRREGGYWLVGDVRNTPGRSMYVRLKDTPKGLAGKWTDAATGEHGDLLDVIRESCGLVDFKDVADEARTFLSMPPPEPEPREHQRQSPVPQGSPEAARRLVLMSQPIFGTLVQANPADYSYVAFCEKAKAAGCAGYLVSFLGRRVVYFGRTAETHVEHFPK